MKPNKVRQLLLKSIRQTASKREFLQNPDSDFTRIRKLPFEVVIRHAERKYLYHVNFSQAAYICRQFFRSNISPPSVETLIARYIVPIRPDRHNARNLAVKSALSFLYRVA